jgi:hypothetical protein
MKRFISIFGAATLAIAIGAPAFAQDTTTVTTTTTTTRRYVPTPPLESSTTEETTTTTMPVQQPRVINSTEIDFVPAGTHGLNMQMLSDFSDLKDRDPQMANQIARTPTIVANQQWVAQHPGLQAFLDRYPDAREEIISSPGDFVTPVNGSTWQSERAQEGD